jgi:hypothetical protein
MAALTAKPEVVPTVMEKTASESEHPGADLKPEVDLKPDSGVKSARTGERNVAGETQPGAGRRSTRKKPGSKTKAAEAAVFTRYFLAKPGTDGIPELDRELEDENQAMIESLKRDGTFLILSEWRPKVDNSTKGRAVIEKEAVRHNK